MLKSFLSIALLWLGLLAFTGNLFKVYGNSTELAMLDKAMENEADDDAETESDNADDSNEKETESYMGVDHTHLTFLALKNKTALFTNAHTFLEQEFLLDLIKPPLVY